MKIYLENLLTRAGIDNLNVGQLVLIILLGLLSVFSGVLGLTQSIPIAISVCICVTVQAFDSIRARIEIQNAKLNLEWPKFLDSIQSATWAGTSLQQAILDSQSFAPKSMRWAIVEFEKDSGANLALDVCLLNLKGRLASPVADRFIEITRLASQSGGRGYLSALQSQSLQLRLENATWREIQVKQNWVLSSAKLAVLAPWLVLVLLGMRRETSLAFQSEVGLAVLGIGLVLSLFAFKLIKTLGTMPKRQRILGS